MKHILAILALCCIATAANAEVNIDGLHEFTRQRIAPNFGDEGGNWYRAKPPTPALKPAPLPPVEFDKPYLGQVVITKWNDYSLIRQICKDVPTAIACAYRTYNGATGAPISCLIMLGPKAHNDEHVLRHEMGHCNGWSEKHEGAR